MIVCLLFPRFSLLGAVGDRRALLTEPVALAPEAGCEQRIGEASAAAEAFGVVSGMRVGEALTRCPELRLVPPDPHGVRTLWSDALDRIERIGASVESDRPGQAFFAADGLRGLHGGRLEDVLAATRRALGRAPAPLASGARIGAGPSRFAAYAVATGVRPGRARRTSALRSEGVVRADRVRAFLAPLPVALLRSRADLADLPDLLDRLGIRTLGQLAALPAAAVAERFGHPGLLALDLARGDDTPLDPRRPAELVTECLSLPEAASGPQLERALEFLIARMLARSERRGRSLRSVAVFASFTEGGTWRTRVTLRQPSADPLRLRLALGPRLAELPAPADELGIEVESFGPPAHDQGRLIADAAADRRARLGEAVRHVRQVSGDAALRVLDVDSGSRVPERRSVLAPYSEEGGG